MTMFRPMRREKQALTKQECEEILLHETRGVLSVTGDDGWPYGTPVNHWYDAAAGKLYFHSGKIGHRVDALKKDDRVCFCIYDRGFRREGEWALNVRCVILFGRAKPMEDQAAAMEVARKLCAKFPCGREYADDEIARSGKATLVWEITVEHMTGKLVNEA